ncbi:multiple coagulation factor deficiency protein 2 homolog isoform X1 [Rhopalosiphum padi]|uniref:multiple coagulation factor deficiency protein 2 homolog isoform X1 n=1 Tax=Rhopalosiphum padi TaxID=40932 RepID=UPI00298E6A7B|nr:multiple coagulation factor deficiency protein 2 homolog isoform X1 [Rhopalosiphum padi]
MISKTLLVTFPILVVLCHKSSAQYAPAPPGVNPQLYQQQQQQVPIQHLPPQQNVPQQVPYQQPPPQTQQQQHHQQQQPPTQQQQPSHGHGSQGHHPHTQQVLHNSNLAEESEHIKKHLDLPTLDTSKMSEQELQFHYFKMHDADNNNKLDGCELIKSLIHWHVQGGHDPAAGGAPPQEKIFTDEELMQLIDPILTMDDTDFDGFIDYPEFVIAQNKAGSTQKQSA